LGRPRIHDPRVGGGIGVEKHVKHERTVKPPRGAPVTCVHVFALYVLAFYGNRKRCWFEFFV